MNQPSTRVILVRHGETEWNVNGRIQGNLDIPLNDHGRWQAQQVARALAERPLDAVYASDLLRARETAGAIAGAHDLPLAFEPGLRERVFGQFEGHTFQEIDATWPDAASRWRHRDPEFAPPGGGESLRTFFARVVETAERLAHEHPEQTIALVTHGGVLDALYRAATRQALQAPRTWLLGNASINRLLWTPAGFTLVGWADTQHLDQEPLAPHGEPTDVEPLRRGWH